MGKPIFDFTDGDYVFSASGDTAMDSEGHLMMRSGDNAAIDLETGELHITSSWNDDEDD